MSICSSFYPLMRSLSLTKLLSSVQVDRPTSNLSEIVQLVPAEWWPDLEIAGHFLVGAGWGLTNEPVEGCPSCYRTSQLQEYAVPLISTQQCAKRTKLHHTLDCLLYAFLGKAWSCLLEPWACWSRKQGRHYPTP